MFLVFPGYMPPGHDERLVMLPAAKQPYSAFLHSHGFIGGATDAQSMLGVWSVG